MICTCEDWLEGISQIAAQAAFCTNQNAGPIYTASKFKYCPWCGRILDPIQAMSESLGNLPGSQEDWETLIDEPYG